MLAGGSWSGTGTQANSIWVNNGNGVFHQDQSASEETSLYDGYTGFSAPTTTTGYFGDIVPMKTTAGVGFLMDGRNSQYQIYVFAKTNSMIN